MNAVPRNIRAPNIISHLVHQANRKAPLIQPLFWDVWPNFGSLVPANHQLHRPCTGRRDHFMAFQWSLWNNITRTVLSQISNICCILHVCKCSRNTCFTYSCVDSMYIYISHVWYHDIYYFNYDALGRYEMLVWANNLTLIFCHFCTFPNASKDAKKVRGRSWKDPASSGDASSTWLVKRKPMTQCTVCTGTGVP